jgi:hypothetical protein
MQAQKILTLDRSILLRLLKLPLIRVANLGICVQDTATPSLCSSKYTCDRFRLRLLTQVSGQVIPPILSDLLDLTVQYSPD